MKRFLLLAAALLLGGAPVLRADDAAVAPPPSGTYRFDTAHTQLGFKVVHLVISHVSGKFDTFEGTIVVKSPTDISVRASADAASVDTGNEMRDAHLRGTDPNKPKDDFFYAEKYPKLTFKSTQVTLNGDQLTVVGDLTIRGVTKSVTFNGTYGGYINAMGQRIAASLTTTINRKDFGLKFNYAVEAGPIVGDNVELNLDVEAVKGMKMRKH
jgi:polyisoprenoid-binding protein YceI